MAKRTTKGGTLTRLPPEFPALTKAQKAWVSARRSELKAAIDAGIESGTKEGYRAFDPERILTFIEQRRAQRTVRRAKRG